MNYQKIYNQLIEKRKTEVLSKKEVYCECHHIIPRCMSGTDDASNLVNLTSREHFLAHWLLHRIHPNSSSLSYAFYAFVSIGKSKIKFTLSSRAYSEAKENLKVSKETKIKVSETLIKNKSSHFNILNANQKVAIVQLDKDTRSIIRIWPSIKEAEVTLNIKHICRNCRKIRKTAGGFIWEYYKNLKLAA